MVSKNRDAGGRMADFTGISGKGVRGGWCECVVGRCYWGSWQDSTLGWRFGGKKRLKEVKGKEDPLP